MLKDLIDHGTPFLIEPLKVERIQIAIANLPKRLEGTKIIQLSDFHFDGVRLSSLILEDILKVTHQENADIIVLTGDYITYRPDPIWELVETLKHCKSRLGIYAILGNHDLYHKEAKPIISQALKSINIEVLWNQIATPLGDDFPILGLADYWSKEFKPDTLFSQISSSIPRLVLCHNPDAAVTLAKWRVDLQLSGHTHGGQLAIPYMGSIPTLISQIKPYVPQSMRSFLPLMGDGSHVVKNWQWAKGLHSLGNNLLYVNRGLGSYFPGRLFCPPELTVITLLTR